MAATMVCPKQWHTEHVPVQRGSLSVANTPDMCTRRLL